MSRIALSLSSLSFYCNAACTSFACLCALTIINCCPGKSKLGWICEWVSLPEPAPCTACRLATTADNREEVCGACFVATHIFGLYLGLVANTGTTEPSAPAQAVALPRCSFHADADVLASLSLPASPPLPPPPRSDSASIQDANGDGQDRTSGGGIHGWLGRLFTWVVSLSALGILAATFYHVRWNTATTAETCCSCRYLVSGSHRRTLL